MANEATLTPPEVAERYRVKADKVLNWIRTGQLRAINVATSLGGRPRWRITLADLLVFEEQRKSGPVAMVARRRRRQPSHVVEYF